MKGEPITALGFATAVVRAGLRARTIFLFAVVARRTREMAVFAALARAMVLGFARRTVLRTGRLPFIALRARDTVRFAAVLRLAVMLRLATVLRFAVMRRLATALRFAAMLRLATVVRFAATVLRAGLARRTVLRAVVFPCTARRVREGVFFAVRFRRVVLDLVNIIDLPTWLKVRRG